MTCFFPVKVLSCNTSRLGKRDRRQIKCPKTRGNTFLKKSTPLRARELTGLLDDLTPDLHALFQVMVGQKVEKFFFVVATDSLRDAYRVRLHAKVGGESYYGDAFFTSLSLRQGARKAIGAGLTRLLEGLAEEVLAPPLKFKKNEELYGDYDPVAGF